MTDIRISNQQYDNLSQHLSMLTDPYMTRQVLRWAGISTVEDFTGIMYILEHSYTNSEEGKLK